MNIIYIVYEVEDYEGIITVGVFSTEELAKNKVLMSRQDKFYYYIIDYWKVNENLIQRSFYINGNWEDTNWPFNYPK